MGHKPLRATVSDDLVCRRGLAKGWQIAAGERVASAFDSRAKARPTKRDKSFTRELRVRHDRIDAHGVVTIRYKSKLHHIGMGRALKGTRIIVLVAGRHIRIITTDGELLRDFELDPDRNYQPQCWG